MLAVFAVACLIVFMTGCMDQDKVVDITLHIEKGEDGAELRRGESAEAIARLDLARDADGEYTGELKLYLGEETWLRVWKEDDKGTQKLYLESPNGAMLLDSWTDASQKVKVRYNGIGDETVSGDGISLGLELPKKDDDTGYVLLSIDDEGTLQLSIYLDRKVTEGTTEQLSELYLYRLIGDQWTAQDRVASVSRNVNTGERDLPSGTYTITVDVARDGSTRQLTWERTGLGVDGYRFRAVCKQDGKQVAVLQTLADTLGDVIVENAEFAGDMPFVVDEDGRVRRDEANDLFTWIAVEHSFAYTYNGDVDTEMTTQRLKNGSIGGFASELLRMDEVYEGNRAEDAQLARPKSRKYLCLRFYDELSNTTAEVPIAYSEWRGDGLESVSAADIATRVSLQPEGSDGWNLICSPVEATDLSSESADGQTARKVEVKVGTIELGNTKKQDGSVTYNGDVRIAVTDTSDFRLYRRCDGQVCRVYAEFGSMRWLLAECPAEAGSAPALTVSRYVEIDDYVTPLTIYKLFYHVQLPDGTEIAQFLTTNDGRLVVRLKADPTVEEILPGGNDQNGDAAGQGGAQDDTETGDAGTKDDAQDGDADKKETAQDDQTGDAGQKDDVQGGDAGQKDSAQDGNVQDNAADQDDQSGDAGKKTDDTADLLAGVLQGSKPTDIEIDFAFRFEGENTTVNTAVTERIVRNGTILESASARVYSYGGDTTEILVGAEGSAEKKYIFRCIEGGKTEAAIKVSVGSDVSFNAEDFVLVERESGEEISPVQFKGGLLYAGDSCVDSMSTKILQVSGRNGTVKSYCPIEEWKTYETEHLIIRLRIVRDLREAEKALDGTVITPACARRIVWVEITERGTGDSWSYPLGYGSWETE